MSLEYCYLIDIKVRNIFNKEVSSSVLKCIHGMNMHRLLDYIINKYKANNMYLMHREIKTWIILSNIQ